MAIGVFRNGGGAMSKKAKSQFLIIDTDTPGMSRGQFSASGPYTSKAAAESYILNDARTLWEDSCDSIKSEKTVPWCNPLHIVEVRRTVIPKITANVVLEEVAK